MALAMIASVALALPKVEGRIAERANIGDVTLTSRDVLDAGPCRLLPDTFVSGWRWQPSWFTPGLFHKEYWDPSMPNRNYGNPAYNCGPNPYPFRIDSLQAGSIFFPDSGYFTFYVDIECPTVPGMACSKPGTTVLWSSGNLVANIPSSRATWWKLVIPNGICVDGPFFVGFHYVAWQPKNPVGLTNLGFWWDDTPDLQPCEWWVNIGGCYYEGVNDIGFDGHPLGLIYGTANAACEPIACPNPGWDMGNLAASYPTLPMNPAHALTGIAWLGNTVLPDAGPGPIVPGWPVGDNDGVQFPPFWIPCTFAQVAVTVTAGPNYADYCGNLYLNAWKDGNLNGTFCDVLCEGDGPEWFIQNAQVTPGTAVYDVVDPGLMEMTIYDGIFRFRLTEFPLTDCIGAGGVDFLGEVEDYVLTDYQLPVELSSFDVVPTNSEMMLKWVTASETRNDHFEIMRDGITVVNNIASKGNDATGHTYTWVDNNVNMGTVYTYKLVTVDVSGNRKEAATKVVTMSPSSAAEVTEYALRQNYPNPFNPTTSISFDVLNSGYTSLKVYNLLGEEVATLVNGSIAKGVHTVNFDAANLPSGVYVYRLSVNGFAAEKKMLLMK